MKSKTVASAMAAAAADKKAQDIVIVNMRKVSGVCNYFVLATSASTTQAKAVADNIIKKLKEKNQKLWHIEGEREASWILLDYGDVVGHVFLEDTRRFYDLERLWGKAPQERFVEKISKKAPRRKQSKPKRKTRAKKK